MHNRGGVGRWEEEDGWVWEGEDIWRNLQDEGDEDVDGCITEEEWVGGRRRVGVRMRRWEVGGYLEELTGRERMGGFKDGWVQGRVGARTGGFKDGWVQGRVKG